MAPHNSQAGLACPIADKILSFDEEACRQAAYEELMKAAPGRGVIPVYATSSAVFPRRA